MTRDDFGGFDLATLLVENANAILKEKDVIVLMEEILHQLIGSLHPWWCRISSINSILSILILG